MSKERVVVTGLGMITALGSSVESTWRQILASKSGASYIDTFDVSDFACRFSASIKNFNPEHYAIPH